MPAQEYLRRILTARVYDVAIESPLEPAPRLSERLGKTLPYDTLDQLRTRLFAEHPTFGQIDWAPKGQADLSAIGAAGEVGDAPLASAVKAFHLTNPVARASVTMAECAALAAVPAKLAAE